MIAVIVVVALLLVVVLVVLVAVVVITEFTEHKSPKTKLLPSEGYRFELGFLAIHIDSSLKKSSFRNCHQLVESFRKDL